jgi:GNAT superfamily N-acetyltransferase
MSARGEIELELHASDELPDAELVKGWLRAHNVAAVPALWAYLDGPEGDPTPLFVAARDTRGRLVGGLIGSTQLAWLRIDTLAVHPEGHGQGIGAALLRRAEEEGRARGCRYAYVDTMSHQAPGFDEGLGYTRVGFLSDWDSHGHDKSFFRKALGT